MGSGLLQMNGGCGWESGTVCGGSEECEDLSEEKLEL